LEDELEPLPDESLSWKSEEPEPLEPELLEPELLESDPEPDDPLPLEAAFTTTVAVMLGWIAQM
jgi:hypothetical protein